ncbi:hypothetical protein OROMI_015469 [Orobanche minor]
MAGKLMRAFVFDGYVGGVVSLKTADVSGEVVGIGSQVKNFKPGDKVVAILNILVSLRAVSGPSTLENRPKTTR